MRKILPRLSIYLITLCTLFSLTSCEEDYWWDDYGDDAWAAQQLIGQWNIVEAAPWGPGDFCPYERGDVMVFQADGIMRNYGFDLNEMAYWSVRNRYVYLDFGGGTYDYVKAYINQMERDYLVLDVTDNAYGGTRYRLRLVYAGRYVQKK